MIIKNLTITLSVLILLTAFSFSAKADGFCEIILNQSFVDACTGMDTHDTSDDIIAYNIDAAVLDGGPSNMYHVYDGAILLATFTYGTGGQTFNIAADNTVHIFDLVDVDDPTCTYSVTSEVLAYCSPTCDDGIQNGDETGTDCGGAFCAACLCDLTPTNHSVVMTSPTTAFFDWDDMAGAIQYQVFHRLKGETNPWTIVGVTNSEKTLTFQNKRNYQYKLRSKCADNTWSPFTEVVAWYSSQCEVPAGVAAIAFNNTTMRVRWDSNPDEIKGKVRYRQQGTSTWFTKNSAGGNNFIFVPDFPTNAIVQYKVRSNCDGNDWSAYSSPLMTVDLSTATRISQSVSGTTLSPNPAKEILNLAFKTIDASEVTITISDNLGKEVLSMNNTYQEGTQRETLDISRLAKGYYFVSIHNGEKVETMKFIKL